MQHNEIDAIKKEVKKEFELERLKLFSDAVFAIVITMVLNLLGFYYSFNT